ncbi:hypothetical protein L596_012095 [Steinernema carpocapsae]|uniref:G-protein coupled receptors family 1 profile domain-containing protein n=1 Tax=Steinernema carpocapsae TaxID=34508 RepID=A0A4U5NWW1_STECR|nr:hypothetical protein L596_012095 [Steinernema carpocapsae]
MDIAAWSSQEFRERTAMVATVLHYIGSFILTWTINLYLFQATLTVLLAYIGVVKPFLYQKIIKNRGIFYAFSFAHLLSATCAFSQKFEEISLTIHDYSETLLYIQTLTRLSWLMFFFFLLILISILTLFKLTRYVPCNHQVGNSCVRTRRNMLRSLLIYCAPPNIFVVIGITGAICGAVNTTLRPKDLRLFASECTAIRDLANSLITPRLLITSISALIVFVDYRKALVGMFRRKSSTVAPAPFAHSCSTHVTQGKAVHSI